MLEKISGCIVGGLIDKELIKLGEEEIYKYGAQLGIAYILNFVFTLICGIVFNVFLESIVFFLAYFFLRIYVGGYHASNYKLCFAVSAVIIASVMKITSSYSYGADGNVMLMVMVLSGWSLYKIGPVEDGNKKLSVEEILQYGKNIKYVLIAEFILFIFFYIFKLYMLMFTLVSVWCVMLVLSFAGYVKNHRHCR